MKTKWWHNGFFYLIVIIAALVVVFTLMQMRQGPAAVDLDTFISYAKPTTSESGEPVPAKIDTIKQDGDTLSGLKGGEAKYKAAFVGGTNDLRDYLMEKGVNIGEGGIKIDVAPTGTNWGLLALQIIVPLLLIGALFYFFLRSARGAGTQAFNFGKSRARLASGNRPTVTLPMLLELRRQRRSSRR